MSEKPVVTRQDSIVLFLFVVSSYAAAAYVLSYVGAPVVLTGAVVVTIIPVLIAIISNRKKVIEWYYAEVDKPRRQYFGARNQTRGVVFGGMVLGWTAGLIIANDNQTGPFIDRYGSAVVIASWVALFLLTRQSGPTQTAK